MIGLLVARTMKLLKTKYGERIAIVRIQKTGLGTVASAMKVEGNPIVTFYGTKC